MATQQQCYPTVAEQIESTVGGEVIEVFIFDKNPFCTDPDDSHSMINITEKNTYFAPGTVRGPKARDNVREFPPGAMQRLLPWSEAKRFLDWDEGAGAIPCFRFQTKTYVYEFRWTSDCAANCGAGLVRLRRTERNISVANPLKRWFG